MGFNSTYRKLQEIFPQLDARLLKAVAIEHPKDPDFAVEVVLSDVLPFVEKETKLPHSSALNLGSNVQIDVEVEHEEPSLLTRRRPVPKNHSTFASTSTTTDGKRSDTFESPVEFPKEVHEEPCSVASGSFSNGANENNLFSASSTNIDQDKDCDGNSVLVDEAPTYDAYHDEVQTLGTVDQNKTMPNSVTGFTSDVDSLRLPCALGANGIDEVCESEELILLGKTPEAVSCPSESSLVGLTTSPDVKQSNLSVAVNDAKDLEGSTNLSNASCFRSNNSEKSYFSSSSLEEVGNLVELNTLETIQKHFPQDSDSRSEVDALRFRTDGKQNGEKADAIGFSLKIDDAFDETVGIDGNSEVGHPVEVDTLGTIQKHFPQDSDSRSEVDAHHFRSDVKQNDEKADAIGFSLKIDDAFDESVGIDGNSSSNVPLTRSVHLCYIDDLEQMIDVAKSNKKTLFSAMESVISMMREVEECEKAAELAKEEAAKGGMDILLEVEELKKMLLIAKDANDMHAGEVYGEKAVLATELKELQSRLYILSDERDKSLAILDEMRESLETRLSVALDARKAAEQEKLKKENLARSELAIQEAVMEKVVEESIFLQEEAERNSKLREFLMDRGQIVDTLQGEISVICQDVKLLKKNFDEHVPLSQSVSSSQTSCVLASSNSSTRRMPANQILEEDGKCNVPKSSSNKSLNSGLQAEVEHDKGVAVTDCEKLMYDWSILDKDAEVVEPGFTDDVSWDRLGEPRV